MSKVLRKPATYEDLLRVPDNLVAELIDGELYVSPRPRVRHARVGSVLGGRIGHAFDSGDDGPGGWWILDEPEIHLPVEQAMVSDVAGWRRERVPSLPDTLSIDIAPDWVCEVSSPSTARLDRVIKLPVYARHGVGHVWLIDPSAQTLEVLRLDGDHWVVAGNYAGDDVVRAEPFDAVELPLAKLWLTPPSPQS